jgi:hypothetical protein
MDRARGILARVVGCDDVAELRVMAEVIASVPSDDRGVLLEAISFLIETHPSATHHSQRVTAADLAAVRAQDRIDVRAQELADISPAPSRPVYRGCVHCGCTIPGSWVSCSQCAAERTFVGEPIEVRELPTIGGGPPDIAMDDEPRRKPPAPAPAEVEIGSLVHAQCGEVVVTGTVTCIERSAIATVYYIHSPHGSDYSARLVALVESVTADPAEPTWRQTAENLREAHALLTKERDHYRGEAAEARKDCEEKALAIRDYQRREATIDQCFNLLVKARLISQLSAHRDLKVQLLLDGCKQVIKERAAVLAAPPYVPECYELRDCSAEQAAECAGCLRYSAEALTVALARRTAERDETKERATAGQHAQRTVRELRALVAVDDDGPEGSMGPSWILGQVRQLLGQDDTILAQPQTDRLTETLDLTGPGLELGGES